MCSRPSLCSRVQQEDFDPGREEESLVADCQQIGAVVCFTGRVRDFNPTEGGVSRLVLEHYPGMTEAVLEELGNEAVRRFDLINVRIVHRFGDLPAGARIVWIGCASSHSDGAFTACRWLIETLKDRAPFGKKETGSSRGH